MARLILLISAAYFLCLPLKGWSQLSAYEVGGMTGNMLDIYPGMPVHAPQKSAFGAVRWGNQSPYSELFGSPEHGVLASFHDLGNRSVLGYGIGLQYQVSFNQYLSRRWRTFERINVGGIFVTKPYDFLDNPDNLVFGSHGSALIAISAGVRYKLGQNALNLQASYWHSSNAHTVLPNVGMNTPMLMLGFEHFFYIEDIYIVDTTHVPFSLPAQWGMIARIGLGRNEAGGTVRPTNGSKYHKQVLALGASYRYKTIHRLSFTLEAYHDQAYALWNETMQWSQNRRFLGASVLMCMVGHEFIFGHFGVVIQAGVNVYNPTLDRLIGEVERPTFSNKLKRYVPGRFAVRYYVNKDETNLGSLFLQAAVKSNMGQADFLELGLGTIISGRQAER